MGQRVTLLEVFTMADQQDRAAALRAVILARIDAIGQAEVARRVAPLWGWSPRDAEGRLSRWRKVGQAGGKDMSSDALFALLAVLDIGLVQHAAPAVSERAERFAGMLAAGEGRGLSLDEEREVAWMLRAFVLDEHGVDGAAEALGVTVGTVKRHVKEQTMEPFGHKNFDKNKDTVGPDETPCGYCGKGCKKPWKDAVRVRTDRKFAARDEEIPEGYDQGCWPVGPDCARKLRAAGVPVFAWEE
jgi:hypothetical protein